jgi:hypothetical protein
MKSPPSLTGFSRWLTYYYLPYYRGCKKWGMGIYRELFRAIEKAWPIKQELADEENLNTVSSPQVQPEHHPAPESFAARVRQEREKGDHLDEITGKHVQLVNTLILTVMASLLPVVAIIVLSQLHGTRDLLLCLAAFVITFAIGLVLVTEGASKRGVEIFSAIAVYVLSFLLDLSALANSEERFAAVLVVFISAPAAGGSSPGSFH